MTDLDKAAQTGVVDFDKELELRNIKIIKYKYEKDFTVLSNDFINDENLCAESVSFLVYIMSKPDDWVIQKSDLSRRFGVGRNKTYEVLKKLIDKGYMRRYQPRDSDGTLLSWVTQACDKPIFKKVVEQPLPGFGDAVKKTTASRFTGSRKLTPYKEINTNTSITRSNTYENNNNKINGARDLSPVVVAFLKDINLSEVKVRELLTNKGKTEDYVLEKIKLYEHAKAKGAIRESDAGWFWRALEADFPLATRRSGLTPDEEKAERIKAADAHAKRLEQISHMEWELRERETERLTGNRMPPLPDSYYGGAGAIERYLSDKAVLQAEKETQMKQIKSYTQRYEQKFGGAG